jgi:hypothetical protein
MDDYLLKLKKSFRKYLLITTILVLNWLLISCSPGIVDQASETRVTISATPDAIEIAATPGSIMTQAITPTASATPQPSATPVTPTSTEVAATPDINTTIIQQQCAISDPILMDETEVAEGLLLRGTWEGQEGIAVLGKDGLHQPLLFVPDSEGHLVWPYESPDKEWIAYTEMLFDKNDNTWFIEIIVWNPNRGEEIRKTFENIRFLAYDATLRWANDSQLIIPLENEEELFRWLVWSPFTDKQEMLSVELPGIGNHMSYFQVPPSLDPRLEFVAYPCEFCDEAEYAVKSKETGETAWLIDLGPKPSYAYRSPVIWSFDGEFVAIAGGRNLILNGLWIFNRQGELIHEIVLPDIGGIIAANLLNWSPNGEYLAFSRGSYNEEKEIVETLTYVSLSDGSVTDLCLDFSAAVPIWSPDSTKIAFSQQIESSEQTRLISIVDIHSGDVVQLYDAEGHNLVGWITLLDEQ